VVTGTAPPFGLIFLLIPNGGGMTPSADRDLRGVGQRAGESMSPCAHDLRADHDRVRYRPVCGTGYCAKALPGVRLPAAFKQLCHYVKCTTVSN
jgi:hypothetical protein